MALITCAQGAPVLMQGDKRLELPAEKGARTLAAIDRSGTFIVLGATKGGVFLLDATSLQVLDALPVRFGCAYHLGARVPRRPSPPPCCRVWTL